jgi:predicted negative regulator of RcsB-dependent stress response
VDDYKSEKEQWEDIKSWIKENGAWIVAGVVIGVGGLYGYRFWQARQNEHAIEAHVHYGNVLNALNRDKKDEALKEIAALDNEYARTPYGDQARLALARWYVAVGKVADAAVPLRKVMEDSRDDVLRHTARLRLARVLADTGKLDDALKLIDGAGSSGFDPRYQEVRGDILLAKGNRTGALAAYRAAASSKVPEIVNEDLLKLKIADLADVAPVVAGTAATPKETRP